MGKDAHCHSFRVFPWIADSACACDTASSRSSAKTNIVCQCFLIQTKYAFSDQKLNYIGCIQTDMDLIDPLATYAVGKPTIALGYGECGLWRVRRTDRERLLKIIQSTREP